MDSNRPRLLVVWHGALFPEYRKPFDFLHRSTFDVTLLVPDRWRQALIGEQRYVPDDGESFHTVVETVRWPDWAVVHSYPRLQRVLRDVAPDILLAIEEPYSLITARLLRWCRRHHIPFAFHTYQDIYKCYPPPFCWTQRYVLRKSDLAFVANQTVERVLHRKGFEGPIQLLPYGVDPERFSPEAREFNSRASGHNRAREKNKVTIGYVGRFVPEKGIDLLIETAQRLPANVRIVLAGDGPERDRLVAQAVSNGVADRIEWKGAAPHEELPEFYRQLDILVLPSRTRRNWQEQFGRVLVEAMACGTVVVGSTCGAIPEVIGDAGLLFPEDDVEALANSLRKLIESPERRASLAALGRARVIQKYTHERQAEILRDSLSKILIEE